MGCFDIFGGVGLYTSNLGISLCKSKEVGDLGFCRMEDKWGRKTTGENALMKILERQILQSN